MLYWSLRRQPDRPTRKHMSPVTVTPRVVRVKTAFLKVPNRLGRGRGKWRRGFRMRRLWSSGLRSGPMNSGGSTMAVDVQQITGTARSVSELLSNNRYGLDFYQREFSWEETQVGELIDDLAARFLDEFDPGQERRQVLSYRPYFLGPIVTAQRDGVRYLVDGQQRVTTLSLLLIYVRSCLIETRPEEGNALDSLIFSFSLGQKTFNLDVDERKKCLSAIIEGHDFDPRAEPESVRNLWERYGTIVERFPDDLQDETLPTSLTGYYAVSSSSISARPTRTWRLRSSRP